MNSLIDYINEKLIINKNINQSSKSYSFNGEYGSDNIAALYVLEHIDDAYNILKVMNESKTVILDCFAYCIGKISPNKKYDYNKYYSTDFDGFDEEFLISEMRKWTIQEYLDEIIKDKS